MRRALLLGLFPLLAVGGNCARAPRVPASATVQTAAAQPSAPPQRPEPLLGTLAETRGWARARGGTGGRIVRVTSLAATGPGSLAEALTLPGPRIVVFEVGGVIDLGQSQLSITEPFVTVAGQTAPPPGITLIKGGIRIKTHDVVIQHLRVRPGEAGMPKRSGWEVDGIATGSGARDVIVDHCSTTWATDENLSASGDRFQGETPDAWRRSTSHRITFSNNIVAEGLSNSTHAKGEHSKGSLIHDNVTDVTIVRNLYASNVERNPFFKGGARGVVVNNLIANPAQYAMKYTLVAKEWGDRPYQTGAMAVVSNVLVHGPATPAGMPLLYSTGPGRCELYLHDNITRARDGAAPPLTGGNVENFLRAAAPPSWPDGLTPLPAERVEEHVLANAGARPWDRDTIDARIVEQVRLRSGAIVDSERDVGGYPVLPETRQPFDASQWDLGAAPQTP